MNSEIKETAIRLVLHETATLVPNLPQLGQPKSSSGRNTGGLLLPLLPTASARSYHSRN
jgi:hypothetical protein